jgi:hypothetical protein
MTVSNDSNGVEPMVPYVQNKELAATSRRAEAAVKEVWEGRAYKVDQGSFSSFLRLASAGRRPSLHGDLGQY